MKGKVVADNQIQNLCNETANLSDNVKSLVSTNERLTSELSVLKNVNNALENRIVNLAHTIAFCRESVRVYKGKVGSAECFVSELL